MLTQMVGLRSAFQIWEKLIVYYVSDTRAKVRKLKLQLKTPKRDRTISAYLLDIKKIIDSLAAIGATISSDDHIDTILDGLSEEYDTFITSRLDPYNVEDVEALLLAQEERFEKHKSVERSFIQPNANYTH